MLVVSNSRVRGLSRSSDDKSLLPMTVDVDAGADQLRDDVGLQVREGEDEVRPQCEDLRDVGAREGRDARLLTAHARRGLGVARNADDAVFLSER